MTADYKSAALPLCQATKVGQASVPNPVTFAAAMTAVVCTMTTALQSSTFCAVAFVSAVVPAIT